MISRILQFNSYETSYLTFVTINDTRGRSKSINDSCPLIPVKES